MTNVITVPIEDVMNHPNNIRRDLGDLTELAASIRTLGLLQLPTVIPARGEKGKYYTLIGNRRLAAAKEAGLKEISCVLRADLADEISQVKFMFHENMERNDLDPYDQGFAYQMMLDLGESVQDIAKDTGFSEPTIRNRLKLVQLDEQLYRESREKYNYSLEDYESLSRLSDIETQNLVLSKAHGKGQLPSLVSQYMREKEEKDVFGKAESTLEQLGLKKLTAEDDDSWLMLNCVYNAQAKDNAILLAMAEKGDAFISTKYCIKIFRRKTDADRAFLAKEDEMKRKVKEANEKLTGLQTSLVSVVKKYLDDIFAKKVHLLSKKEEDELIKKAWSLLFSIGGNVSADQLGMYFSNLAFIPDEEAEEVYKKLHSLSTLEQMLLASFQSLSKHSCFLHRTGEKKAETLEKWKSLTDILNQGYGFIFADEAVEAFVNGTSPCFLLNDEAVEPNTAEVA